MANGFKTDKQTLKDLQVFGMDGKSIFRYFDKTVSDGGRDTLRHFFSTPLADIDKINERQEIIRLILPDLDFSHDKHVLKDLGKYLASYLARSKKPTLASKIRNMFIRQSAAYYYKERSVRETIETLLSLKKYLEEISSHALLNAPLSAQYANLLYCIKKLLKPRQYDQLSIRITVFNIDRYDFMIRSELRMQLKEVLQFVYDLDAYRSVAITLKELGLTFPEINPKGKTGKIEIKGLYHLFNEQPVENDVLISQDKKIWFLTGANMAGKSTFIKSLSIASYLAHIGFPVPAESMKIDLMDGLYSTINLDDDIDLGYSHFYNEAVRLKAIVEQLHSDSNALVILDELFNGTNHQDAYDAIYEIIKLFSEMPAGPFVIISSHMTALTAKLKEIREVEFMCMETLKDKDGLPTFPYRLQPGVAKDKLGMWLLDKSGVFSAFEKLVNVN